ncbi:hypothetical protein FISHEDRAFT_69661 [Fistulina hepatica ATCC 64428]|uniref:Uncharacterized protein n=1 Tax=Fistulina hepatica ATCC 64428 TaxID=1128425 RepID=A0A0D7AMU5_9AGAR|nr:hypothetical protein FISHEDRAFT_69661 [Fistulina hepatica ATCC 64428]
MATLEELNPESPGFNVNEWTRNNGDATRSNDNKNGSGGGGKAEYIADPWDTSARLCEANSDVTALVCAIRYRYDTDPRYSQDLPFFSALGYTLEFVAMIWRNQARFVVGLVDHVTKRSASGEISIVIHPCNPNAPSAHAD